MISQHQSVRDAEMPAPERTVSFLDLPALFRQDSEEYFQIFDEVASQAQFVGGKWVSAFEKSFASWVGPGFHAVGCGNGTDAILLAAKALGIEAGSEAIIPAMTFIATAEALAQLDIRVRLVDVRAEDGLMDVDQLEAAIGPKTRLIVPVHLYGQMVQMDRVRALADKHGIKIIEDAAQAHGATWKGHAVGHYGDLATFSFFPGKNLGAFGDAGAVLSKSAALVETCSALGKHGGLKKHEHTLLGWNSRLDGLQAAILCTKLKRIDQWTAQRRKAAALYRKGLSGIEGLELLEEHPDSKAVYHIFKVRVHDRLSFQNYLKVRGIETAVHYPLAIHQHACFSNVDFGESTYPQAERLAARGVSLPMGPTLTEDEINYVCKVIRNFFGA